MLTRILISLMAIILSTIPAHAETITIAADEWCPYNCAEGAPLEGYAVDIMREIFEPVGITVEYRTMSWIRAIEEANRGNVTAIIAATWEESPNFIHPKGTIGIDAFGFYVRAGDDWRYDGPESLIGKRVGIPTGYHLSAKLEAFFNTHRGDVDIYNASREAPLFKNLQLLMSRRVDVVYDCRKAICHTAHTLGWMDSIRFAGSDEPDDELFMSFSPVDPKSAMYAAIFDEGLRRLRASGKLQEILAKYGLVDWKDDAPPADSCQP